MVLMLFIYFFLCWVLARLRGVPQKCICVLGKQPVLYSFTVASACTLFLFPQVEQRPERIVIVI